MDERTLARWRLHALRLAGQPFPSPEAVVGGLLAVQAENYAQASWAVATRTPGMTEFQFGRTHDQGTILRTHVLRPTWHFVLPDDIRWLVEVTAPRVRRSFATVQRQHGLHDGDVQAAVDVIVEALAGGAHRTRSELAACLGAAGLPAEGMPLGIVLGYAELDALACSGVRQGKDHTYALLDERAPHARRLDRDEALAELALRYFAGHGPATERDLAYWATLTLTDVRAGLAAVADRLDTFNHAGRTYWFAYPPPADDAPLSPRGHLLQTLDEYHNGYQDSRYSLDAEGIVPRGRPASTGMVLVDGQMVGGMRRTLLPSGAVFDVELYRDLADDELAALQAAADRYGAFLERDATLVTAPSGRRH